MGTETRRSILRRLAVTVAFAAGSIAVTLGVYAVYLLDETAAARLAGVDWALVGSVIFGNAVVAGLAADVIRFVMSSEALPKSQRLAEF